MKMKELTILGLIALFVSACGTKQVVETDAYLGADALDTPPLEEAENPGEVAMEDSSTPEDALSDAIEAQEEELADSSEGLTQEEETEVSENVEETASTGEVFEAEEANVAELDENALEEEAEEFTEETELDENAVAIAAEVDASEEGGEIASLEEVSEETKVASFKPSKNPVIQSKAFDLGGERVNRYYFARPGDTAESLSQLLYGDESKAAELVAINGKSEGWKKGKVLYYSSSEKPGDEQVKSFYEDRNIVPESYTIEKGDTLSKIAEEKFGNFHNWKELSVGNELSNPDRIVAGATLKIYPNQLNDYAPTSFAVSQNTQEPDLDTLVFEGTKTESLPSLAESMKEVEEKVAESTVETQKPQQANAGIMGFVKQNLLLLLIGLGLVVAAFVGYMMMGDKKEEQF